MHKELVISIVIIITILILNNITQKNTDYIISEVSKNLEMLKEDVLQENPDNEQTKMHADDAYNRWEELDDTLAYYIEHNEIEKVTTALTSVKSYVEVEEYSESLEQINKCIYVLQHIYDKEKFTLDNIF